MPPTTGTTEEIIEKKDASPLGTSCLVLSAFALLGAVIFQLVQISRIQEDLSASQLETIGTERYFSTVVQPALDIQAQDVQETIDEASAQVSPEDEAEWQSIAEGNFPSAAGSGTPEGLPSGDFDPAGIDPTLESEGLDEGGDFGDFDTP